MDQAFALNLFSGPGFSGTAVKPQSLEGISEGLFKSLLTKENRSTSSSRERGIEADLQDTGMVPGMVSWAPGAEEKLTAYLEDKGISGEEAAFLLKGAKGANGTIQLNRLTAALNGRKGTTPGGSGDLIVASRDVPRLQEFLFRMGLGSGEVKSLCEGAGDGKGNVLLSKIVGTLSEKFPDIDSPQKLAALLSQLGIGSRATRAAQHMSTTDLKPFMDAYAETPSEDVRKQIKTVLAQLLQEKGIPPEEVKSFLEGMNVTYAKNISGSPSAKAGELGLWDGLVLRRQYKTKNDPWTEKILAILKDVRTGKQQVDDKKGNFLQPFLSRGGDQANLTNKSVSERLASLLQTGEEGPSSKGQQNLNRQGFGGGNSFALGEMFLKTAAQGPLPDRGLPGSPQAGIFARALDYAQEASPVSSILDRMQWMMQAGKQQARIQLSPPELGHIDLRMVIDQGHLQAHLGTENPLVKEMIESNLGQLKQQLAGLGFVVEEFSVHVGADSRDFMDRDELWGKTGKTGSSGWTREPGIEPAIPDPSETRTAAEDRYQINVRV